MLGIDARAARYTWTAALILLLLWLVYLIRSAVFVFIVALLFAYLLAPLVDIIDRFLPASRTRTPALAIAYLIFLAILFVAVTQIGSRVADQANALAKSMPALLAKYQQPAPESLTAQIIQKIGDEINKNSGDLLASLPKAGAKILSVAGDLVYVVVVPILAFFFLKDGREIRAHFLDLIEDRPWRIEVDEFLADVNLLLASYIRAILMLSLATFICYSIFFTIAGVPYSLLLAALAAMLEIVPMVGPLSAGTIIVIVTAVAGGPVVGAIIFLLVFRVFQDYVLSPQLMRSGMELHPLLVLFGVFSGAEIAGIAGAFLSVPVLALARVVYRHIRTLRVGIRTA